MNHTDTDYLVIGSGTSGVAFTDALIDETGAHVTIVDRHGKPGGHWNDACSFVTCTSPRRSTASTRWSSAIAAPTRSASTRACAGIDPQGTEKQAILTRLKEQMKAAMANFPRLMASGGWR
ncbi:MAG: FAD/NAD(P)-binding protein [Rhizobacter sp.]